MKQCLLFPTQRQFTVTQITSRLIAIIRFKNYVVLIFPYLSPA